MLLLYEAKALMFTILLTASSVLPVWKRLPSDPIFTSGYGDEISAGDE